jgi:hypothetical protein
MTQKMDAPARSAGGPRKPRKAEKVVTPDMVVAESLMNSLNRVHMRTPKYRSEQQPSKV